MKTDWVSGDTVYIYIGDHRGHTSKGVILEVLDLHTHGYSFPQYLIEVESSIENLLEVRDAFTMSEEEDGPVGLWAGLKKGD
jgi:hypothetical protein